MVTLTEEQTEKIKHYIEKYKDKLSYELTGGGWKEERQDRISLYKKLLSRQNIESLEQKGFEKIIKSLWASAIWGNKDYLVNKIITASGLPKIRLELKELLYGSDKLENRFDRFKNNIKGLGPASITEILVFVDPKKYCLWNDKPKNVLPILGMDSLLPERVFKYSIIGKDYVKCNEVLKLVGNELEKNGFEAVDFLDVDIFMWLLFEKEIEKPKRGPKPPKKEEFKEEIKIRVKEIEHVDAEALLLNIGNLLGYETYTPDKQKRSKRLNKVLKEIALLKEIPAFTYEDVLEIVKNIDVIWFKDEYPECCFEVEHTTNVRDGLLRLYQISALKGIKFFVVAPASVFPRFQKEILRKPFKEIKERYIFKTYEDLVKFFIEAIRYHKIKDNFLE